MYDRFSLPSLLSSHCYHCPWTTGKAAHRPILGEVCSGIHVWRYTHIEVGDTSVDLPPVTVGSGGRCGRWQAAEGDGARVPVGPVDTAGLNMDVHGIDADALVTLEGLLIS